MTNSKFLAHGEEPTVFTVKGEPVIGILHRSNPTQSTGVLIVVGGRQYRVGAHRQFVSLARHLAVNGYPVFRFDMRGMGDSSAAQVHFLDFEPDIAAALVEFRSREPKVERILLWGLCDGASAAMLFASKRTCVDSVMMVNPWVTTEGGSARTQIKHYYTKRLISSDFWRKLVAGGVNWRQSISSLSTEFRRSLVEATSDADAEALLPDKVFKAMENYIGSITVIISEKDLTAKEFKDEYDKRQIKFANADLRLNIISVDSDHTFSTPETQKRLEYLTAQWVKNSHIQ